MLRHKLVALNEIKTSSITSFGDLQKVMSMNLAMSYILYSLNYAISQEFTSDLGSRERDTLNGFIYFLNQLLLVGLYDISSDREVLLANRQQYIQSLEGFRSLLSAGLVDEFVARAVEALNMDMRHMDTYLGVGEKFVADYLRDFRAVKLPDRMKISHELFNILSQTLSLNREILWWIIPEDGVYNLHFLYGKKGRIDHDMVSRLSEINRQAEMILWGHTHTRGDLRSSEHHLASIEDLCDILGKFREGLLAPHMILAEGRAEIHRVEHYPVDWTASMEPDGSYSMFHPGTMESRHIISRNELLKRKSGMDYKQYAHGEFFKNHERPEIFSIQDERLLREFLSG